LTSRTAGNNDIMSADSAEGVEVGIVGVLGHAGAPHRA
jgi:hypothetical protein